jgi:hypothetical protein
MIKINHLRIFTHALRTSLLLVASFFIYELLIKLENQWNILNPQNKVQHFRLRKVLKLILIFSIDLLILYGIAIFFGIHN